eukprot:8694672-Pyramimonas_sp.AAC.1
MKLQVPHGHALVDVQSFYGSIEWPQLACRHILFPFNPQGPWFRAFEVGPDSQGVWAIGYYIDCAQFIQFLRVQGLTMSPKSVVSCARAADTKMVAQQLRRKGIQIQ